VKSFATPLFVVITLLMTGLLAWNIGVAISVESVFVAGPRLASDPWGWVTILDLYLGFLFFAGYLVARERSVLRALPWLVGLFCLGNLAAAVYIVWSLHASAYDPRALVRPARG
jgi:hypothetical protein